MAHSHSGMPWQVSKRLLDFVGEVMDLPTHNYILSNNRGNDYLASNLINYS